MAETYTEFPVYASGTRCGMVINKPLNPIVGKKYPLIVFLHGIGECGNGSVDELGLVQYNGTAIGLEYGCKNYGFFLVEPQTDNGRNYGDGEVAESWQYMKDNYDENIDWDKVYLIGLSLGGGGTQRYLAEHSTAWQKFAAAAPMCPGPNQYFILSETGYQNIATNALHMPIWYHHCINDCGPISSTCAYNGVAPSASTYPSMTKILSYQPTAYAIKTMWFTGGHSGGWISFGQGQGSTTNTRNVPGGMVDVIPSQASGSVLGGTPSFNNSAVNLFEWLLMNTISGTPVLPPTPSVTTTTTTTPVPNAAPVARAGDDQTITLPTNSVTLNGNASSDSDGTIISYNWSKNSGPSSYTILSPNSSTTVVSNLTEGTYLFRLRVTDNDSTFADDYIKIIVEPEIVSTTTTTTTVMATDIFIKNAIVQGESRPNTVIVQITWTDGTTSPVYKALTGDRIQYAYLSKNNGLWQYTIKYVIAPTVIIGPRKPA